MLLPRRAELDEARAVTLLVDVEPRGKGRPRAAIRKTAGGGQKLTAVTDKATVDWKKRFLAASLLGRMQARAAAASFRGEPLRIEIALMYEKPKSNKSWWCNVPIDNDNGEKNVWDALQDEVSRKAVGNKVLRVVTEGLIRDDHEIISNECMKDWADGRPYIWIRIIPIKEKRA